MRFHPNTCLRGNLALDALLRQDISSGASGRAAVQAVGRIQATIAQDGDLPRAKQLHLAADAGYDAVVKELLGGGADPNAANKAGLHGFSRSLGYRNS